MSLAVLRLTLIAYYIFMAWDIVGFIVIYIFAVETKQVSRLPALCHFIADDYSVGS